MKRAWMYVGMLALTFVTVGCQSPVYNENVALRKQYLETQQENDRLRAEVASRPDAAQVNAQMSAMQQQLAERDRLLADMQAQLNKPAAGEAASVDNSSLNGITITRDDKAGTVTVNVPGDVLFTSGDAAVKESAKATLNKIAGMLKKDFAGKKVLVDGHTDTDPITKTKNLWKDNLDLSAARARSVLDYLLTQGVEKNRIGARAMGETEPKSSKDKSRRVEIVVITK